MRKHRNGIRESEKIKMLGRQYQLLQQAWSENAMLFHDMENHLQTIYHMAEEGKNEDIRHYISQISRPLEHLSGICWTGTGIVDAVLNAKKQLAQENGCRLDINAQLPANTGIADDDLCTILTNLLDNAIESIARTRKLTPLYRPHSEPAEVSEPLPVIDVSIRSIHHFLVIRISNPCLELLPKDTPTRKILPSGMRPTETFLKDTLLTDTLLAERGLWTTSKEDRLRHGWGLKSVRKTVHKYNGSLSLDVADGRFVAAAMLFYDCLS